MSALLLALWLAQTCAPSALTQSVMPADFQDVKPGSTQVADILIENHNPIGCPAATVLLTAESRPPFTWPTALEGGARRMVESGAQVFTRLHIAVPADAMTGSVIVVYTLDRSGGESFVVPIVVNVQR